MSFWSKIGLASHKELKEMKEEFFLERISFKREFYEFFQEQQVAQERAFENLKHTFEQTMSRLEMKNEKKTESLMTQINDTKSKVSEQLLELNEQGQGLSSKVNTLQEIVKIHWASTLIDYIDELLEGVDVQKQNNGETIHPLAYDFGGISNLFQFVCEETQRAGLYVGWRNTKQTVQIYLREEDGESYQNQVGAIQYEGSNDFAKKPPHTVSWRFIIHNMPKKLVRDLSTILSSEQASMLFNEREDHIVFKFKQDTVEARMKIKKINQALRSSMLLIG
ncbi:MAG TPA: hypothetical protein VNR38_08695 [Ureibacillus sp.]|nr:hypothetical protein [Ureibacillus sp.]